MKINLDETPMQSAERAAETISAFVAATAFRLAHGPASPVTEEELTAFGAMRDALHELASHEYDRGFRRAVAMRKEDKDALRIAEERGDKMANRLHDVSMAFLAAEPDRKRLDWLEATLNIGSDPVEVFFAGLRSDPNLMRPDAIQVEVESASKTYRRVYDATNLRTAIDAAMHSGAAARTPEHPERAPALAVDPSRSTPDKATA